MAQNNNEFPTKPVHHGRNVKRGRGVRLMNQEVFAELMGKGTSWLYELEKQYVIDDKLLQQIADKLKLPIEFFKNLTDETELQINVNTNHGAVGRDVEVGNVAQEIGVVNDVHQINSILKPLYDEIKDKDIEIYRLKEKLGQM